MMIHIHQDKKMSTRSNKKSTKTEKVAKATKPVENVEVSDNEVQEQAVKAKASGKKVSVKSTKQAGGKNVKSGSKSAKSGSKSAKSGSKTSKIQTGGKGDESRDRYFKLIDAKTGRSFGRYTGGTPKQAASKGFTKMIHKIKAEGGALPKNGTMKIYLRESTRGSPRKVYAYEATRKQLTEPQKIEIEGSDGKKKVITYRYRNVIHKVSAPLPNQLGGLKTSRSNKKSGETKKSGSRSSGSKRSAKPTKSAKNTKSTGNKKVSTKSAGAKKAPSAKASR